MIIDFNTLLQFRGFPLKKAQTVFDNIPQRNEIEPWQDEKKWEIFNYHFNHNPHYKSLICNKPATWEELPIITKKQLHLDISINKYDISKRLYVRNTSGSTGKPFTYALDYQSHALTWLLIAERYKSVNVLLNDKQARFYGAPINKQERIKEKIKDTLSNRFRFSLMDLSDKAIEKWISDFKKYKYQYIYGYSFPIIIFSKYLLKKGMVLKQICPTLKAVIVTAEMCPLIEQHSIEKAMGVQVANEYGASEIGIIGFGTTNHWKISDELIYVEIVDDKGVILQDGEIGRIICTPLFNHGTPFVRYDVGDLGSLKKTNNGKILTSLEGRREELMVLPSGKKLPGDTFFYYIFKDFSKRFKEINEYRVIQKNETNFEILIVSDITISEKEIKDLNRIISHKINDDITISIHCVSEIKRSKTGKFRRFISEINR